jgi:hypothetical protein
MSRRALARPLLAGGACLLLLPALQAASPAPSDPWAKVPKLPTACYSGDDPSQKEIDTAIDALNQEITRQAEINQGIENRLSEIDPEKKASMMQEYMMQNPQEAMKVLQAQQAEGQSMGGDQARDQEAQAKLDEELKEIQSKYKTALDTATRPLFNRLHSLPDGEAATPESEAEARALIGKINTEYEKLCPTWWGASSPFPGWLKRYQDHLVKNHIPYLEALENNKAIQYKMFGVEAKDFRPTVSMETVVDYLKKTTAIYSKRQVQRMQS